MKEYTITERLVPVYSTWELRGSHTRVQRARASREGPKAGAMGTVIRRLDKRTVLVKFDEPIKGAGGEYFVYGEDNSTNRLWACRIDTLNRVDTNNLTEVTP